MNKLLISLFILALCPPLAGMHTQSRSKALEKYVQIYENSRNGSIENEIQCFEKLQTSISQLGTLSQKFMTKAIFYTLFTERFPHATQKLLVIWDKEIDMNFDYESTLFYNIVFDYAQLCIIFPKERLETKYMDDYYIKIFQCVDDIETYRQLYEYVSDTFKDKVNVNIKRDGNTLLVQIITEYILNSKDNPYFKSFLKSFLEKFHNHIDIFIPNSDNKTAFEMCSETNTKDLEHNLENKKYVLKKLKKYFPDKLIFTKERLEKAHNCHFRFKNMDKQS